MNKEIKVSIICATYNHEHYIAEAIESFLLQITDFPYEICIHDDASTDTTTEIIRAYERNYPQLIKPIYQTENQYSKGVKTWHSASQHATGTYIAICEGDDYWTDPYKLQKQVDYMDHHASCSLCVHATYKVWVDGERMDSDVRPYQGNKICTVEEVIVGGGGLFASNSMMYRRIYDLHLPDFYFNAPVGDYPLMIHLALQGEVYYIDEWMSAYRKGVPGSWTDREFTHIESKSRFVKQIEVMLDEINAYTHHRYVDAIRTKLKRNQLSIIKHRDINTLQLFELRLLYADIGIKGILSKYLKQDYPRLAQLISTMTKKLRRR